ncbi:MAG: type III pantothenate kinase [Raineya sp.]|jgi:type III pantothenate kinase|nr:type III pantothenate kinase [Raineya sp.]
MMNAVVDIGNTRYKVALFKEKTLIDSIETTEENESLLFIERNQVKSIIVSSVREDISIFIKKLPIKPYILSPELPIPIKNKYKSPQTLGMDRLAAAIGAKSFFPNQSCLVIDLGTCITYDFVTAENEFMGGMIAPGVRMRLKAMHHFTQKLPLVEWEPEKDVKVTGASTQEAILSGAVNGVKGEIYSTRQYYQTLHPDLQTILCGGDSLYFESIKKDNTFAVPKLVLFGLNQILQYNINL